MNFKSSLKLIFCIAITEGAGVIGSLFTVSSVDTWYATINKPSFNPPNWIFGPVWTTLFLLMGIALYLIWTHFPKKKLALGLFAIQLVLNCLWTIIFFSLHHPFYAFIELLLLLFFIMITCVEFWKLNKTAGILLLPYIAWTTFALFLNYAIVRLN